MTPSVGHSDCSDSGEAAEDLAVAGIYPTSADGFGHGLVILAMGLPYWLVRNECGYRLLVEAHVTEPVREQLDKFERESLRWPPRPVPMAAGNTEMATPGLWALVVVAVFLAQTYWPGRLEAAGEVNSRAIFGHDQWWRLGTALFLHADVGHLVSNLLSGIFIFSAVLSTCGRWRGWLLLLGASLAGNFAAAAVHYSAPYSSLGASTAVFAGLGILTARAIGSAFQAHHPHVLRNFCIPLATGVTLLGLYGAGGPEVDVLAHVAGFSAGLILSLAFGWLIEVRRGNSVDQC